MLRFYNLKRVLSSFVLLFAFFSIEMSAFARSNTFLLFPRFQVLDLLAYSGDFLEEEENTFSRLFNEEEPFPEEEENIPEAEYLEEIDSEGTPDLGEVPLFSESEEASASSAAEDDLDSMVLFIPSSGSSSTDIVSQFLSRESAMLESRGVTSVCDRALIINIDRRPEVKLFRNILRAFILRAFALETNPGDQLLRCSVVRLRIRQEIFEIAEQEFNEFLREYQDQLSTLGLTFFLEPR